MESHGFGSRAALLSFFEESGFWAEPVDQF